MIPFYKLWTPNSSVVELPSYVKNNYFHIHYWRRGRISCDSPLIAPEARIAVLRTGRGSFEGVKVYRVGSRYVAFNSRRQVHKESSWCVCRMTLIGDSFPRHAGQHVAALLSENDSRKFYHRLQAEFRFRWTIELMGSYGSLADAETWQNTLVVYK